MGREYPSLDQVFRRNAGSIDPSTGCMIWQGSLSSAGYGQMYFKTKAVAAHRYSFMQAHKITSLESCQFVCHTCDTPACVNPAHLFLGNASINMADKMAKGRHRYPVGIQHGRAKLTEQNINAIRSGTESASALGEIYGVHPQHIRLIRRRKRIWGHVK